MSVITFNLENPLTEKVYPISAPIGEGIDTTTAPGLDVYYDREGVTYRNEGTEETPQWIVDKTLPYAFKHGYSVYFQYPESSLSGNYIELDTDKEVYDSDGSSNNNYGVSLRIRGTGGYFNVALWTEIQYTPDPQTILHTSMHSVGNTGWYRPEYGYPPGITIGTDTNFGVMTPDFTQPLYIPEGKKPRISFHVETAKHGDYLYPIMVVSGWYGYLDGDTVKYGIRWQRIISTSLFFGEAEVVPGKTPSTTPNTTPSGGMGFRDNYSYSVPMPTAAGLSGLNYFSADGAAGIHLYKIDTVNWGKLLSIMWASDWLKKISQSLTSLISGSTKAPADYIISCTKIALPVTIDGEPSATSNIFLGPVQYTPLSSDIVPVAKNLPTRYAETDTYVFDIKQYSGTYLDYDPYTRIELHIPYCGTISVSADACMSGSIEVKYIVDLVTGGCCAVVRCIDQFGTGKIYSVVNGQCGISIPFLSGEYTIDKVFGGIGSIASGALTGNVSGIIGGTADALTGIMPYTGTKTKGISNAGGTAAVLGDRALYAAIYHPQDITGLDNDTPGYQIDMYGDKVGYPAAWFGYLQTLKTDGLTAGQAETYCECIVNPSTIQNATDSEKEYIRQMLQRGVYL